LPKTEKTPSLAFNLENIDFHGSISEVLLLTKSPVNMMASEAWALTKSTAYSTFDLLSKLPL
jgi:hypothetical protein